MIYCIRDRRLMIPACENSYWPVICPVCRWMEW